MRIDAVAMPPLSCHAVPRPSVVVATMRATACRRIASAAGRVNATVCASGVAVRTGGQSQNTASAPSNARSTTTASPCDPSTTSTRSRTSGESLEASRTIRRSTSPASSRWRTTRRPMLPVGVVTTIMAVLR